MTTVRSGTSTQHVARSQGAGTSQPQTAAAKRAATGYSPQSAFEEVKALGTEAKKLLGEWEGPSGFSATRLETLKKEAEGKIDEMLKRSPPPSPDEAVKELEALVNKAQNQALIEDTMFKQLWNDLMASYERSLQAMKEMSEGR